MSFPIYNKLDIDAGSDDAEVQEFKEFISQLHEQDTWEYPAEKGIVAIINSKGTEVLSVGQTKVLAFILSRYQGAECKVCRNEILLSEVLFHEFNHGYCLSHKYLSEQEE